MSGGSSGGVIRIAPTASIPLDTAGNGKAMPLIAGQMIPVTADISPLISAGSVLSGVCVADYVSSGTGNINLAAYFLPRGDTYAAEAARLFTVTYFMQTSGAYAIVQKGSLSATFPFFTAQSPPAGTVGTAYSYTYVAPNATSFALFSGSLPAGVTLNTATGALSGTPTTSTTSNYLVSASGRGGTSLSTAQSVVMSVATGVLTTTTFTPAAAVNLTTIGTTDWGWTVSDSNFRRKLGSAMTRTMFGAGTHFGGSGGPMFTISDGEGGGFNTADTSQSSTGINMDASPGGFQFTAAIGTTQCTVDVYILVNSGPGIATLTLSDGSATLAPFSISGAATLGIRITAKAAAAGQTLTMRFEGTTGAGVSNIIAYALTQA